MGTAPDTTNLDALVNEPSVDDVLATIVAYSRLGIFPSDRKRLHDFVRSVKGDPELNELLSTVVFSEGADLFPFSRTLESALVRLQLGGLFFAKNPEYDKYGMTDEARAKTLRRAKSRFTEPQIRALEGAGRLFREKLGPTPRPGQR